MSYRLQMSRRLAGVMLVALVGTANAQPAPQDPYANPPGKDPVLSEQIAEQLVARAQELFDAKVYVDAKQLAVEALVESPKGNAAERAKFIIKNVNAQLGITDEGGVAPQPPQPLPNVDTTPIEDPTTRQPLPPVEPPRDEGPHGPDDGRIISMGYGAFYGGVFGAWVGSYFSSDHPAAGAVPMGIGLAAGGALLAPRLVDKWKADEAQVRTAGAAIFWGAVAGGLIGFTVQNACSDPSMCSGSGNSIDTSGVLAGAAIGASAGLVAGIGFAKNKKLTVGDVALVDTLAGAGAVGGLTLGMLMQPQQKGGYSLNALLGVGAGVAAGVIAGPETNTTPRRMVRVAGLAAAGGAAPMLILLAGPHKSGVQRAAGGISTLGIAAGLVAGFYLTRHMDEGLDVPPGEHTKPVDKDAPVNPPPPPPMTSPATTNGPMTFVMPLAFGNF
jgi:hypothetical protein